MKKFAILAVAVALGLVLSYALLQGSGKALNVNEISSDPGPTSAPSPLPASWGEPLPRTRACSASWTSRNCSVKRQTATRSSSPSSTRANCPVRETKIRATGKFVKLPEGYLFAAENVKVVRNHKIGG